MSSAVAGPRASRQRTAAAEEHLILSDIIWEMENQPPQPFVVICMIEFPILREANDTLIQKTI